MAIRIASALLNLATNDESARNLRKILVNWSHHSQDIGLNVNTIVTDFSSALLQSVSRAFNDCNVLDTIKFQWDVIFKSIAPSRTKVFLRLCASQYIHSTSRNLRKKFTLSKEVIIYYKILTISC